MRYINLLLVVLFISIMNIHAQENSLASSTPIELQTISGTIYGTLLVPTNTNTKIPVALIIAGSGPTDRDGNNPIMKNNSLKLLAESLANKGIASLRFDKRGIGASKQAAKSESDLKFEDYIQDAIGWINLIKQEKLFSKIIVIGHSEGSLVGMNAAKEANGFISLSGAGNSADFILKNQLSAQGKQIQDMCFPIIDSLKAGKLVSNISPILNSLFRESVQPYMISWFKHNPQADLAQLNYPCLIVQGDNDLQVSIKEAQLLASVSDRHKLVIIEKMNHVLKTIDSRERTVNLAAYSNPNMPISLALTEAIVNYIKE
jgi:alpha/beta superfamily hydrolase